ncbi:DNA-processing protein DprA [Hoeflea sp. BAL378]|uniref:DNA-processing protein DprA n=1 Tax=Hoeflea sp. BAL378 TaxID=1547437 RepID=UPI0009E0A8F8|nr:DNA-processing protein DprA [Hoeflea sp. BAL378]
MKISLDHFDAERVAFLALSSLKGVGFETLRRISESENSFQSVIELEKADAVRSLLGRSELQENDDGDQAWRKTRTRALDTAKRRSEELARSNVSIIFQGDKEFPHQLGDLNNTPQWLFVQGNPNVLSQRSISVVGSRKASQDGVWLTRYVGHWLSEFGVPTVSGLADGIDQVIHSASIDAGVPTIAFLGTGIFTEYPKGSDTLRRTILDSGGAIATEYLIKEGYSAANFVRRNRLQAALSKLLIPTEWAVKSGTAHTVRYAFELSRPVAFLRTPTQPDFNWVPRAYVPNNGFFTIPSDQNSFVDFVSRHLKSDSVSKTAQFKLL